MRHTRLLLAVATLTLAPVAFAHEPAGTPQGCTEDGWRVHDYGPPALGPPFLGPPQDGCTQVVGHHEYALGGAWLLVCDASCGDGDATLHIPPGGGAGSTECFGEPAHHGTFVTVRDVVLGSGVSFTVAADHVDEAAVAAGLPQDPCGDFHSDVSQPCFSSCQVRFGAGLDGSYQVYVRGSQGHVYS